jgi:hypothetical protein
MSQTFTAEELINKAAAILGKYVPGEALGDVEHETIDRAYTSVLDETAKIVDIGDRDAIPALLFETIARMTAITAAAYFSNQPVDYSTVFQHEQRLRYLIAQTPTYEVLGVNYF